MLIAVFKICFWHNSVVSCLIQYLTVLNARKENYANFNKLERKLDNNILKINSVENYYLDEVADFRDHSRDRFPNGQRITAVLHLR